jgi:UPF0755 protein
MAVARVAENEVLTGEVAAMPVEGAIMPETYVFRRGLTRQKMLDDMQAAQAKMLDELWSKRSVSDTVKTKEQAVTLASIVEKETAIPESARYCLGVSNRLKQACACNRPRLWAWLAARASLTGPDQDDLTRHGYNTYKINGLPPDPSNPGEARRSSAQST